MQICQVRLGRHKKAQRQKDKKWQKWHKYSNANFYINIFKQTLTFDRQTMNAWAKIKFPNKLFWFISISFDIFKWLLVIFDRKSLRRWELLFCDVISLFFINKFFISLTLSLRLLFSSSFVFSLSPANNFVLSSILRFGMFSHGSSFLKNVWEEGWMKKGCAFFFLSSICILKYFFSFLLLLICKFLWQSFFYIYVF